MTKDIKETTEYDSFLGRRDDDAVNDVSKFMGDDAFIKEKPLEEKPDEQLTREEFFKKYWKGMPTFDQNDNPPWKQLYVNFRNKEDYEEFAKLVDQKLSGDSKSIWYPKLDIEDNSLHRWIVE